MRGVYHLILSSLDVGNGKRTNERCIVVIKNVLSPLFFFLKTFVMFTNRWTNMRVETNNSNDIKDEIYKHNQ